MCELLIRIRDKADGNDRLLGRGDVVVVCPDDHPWSQLERDSDDWRIVKVPQMSMQEAADLLEPQMAAVDPRAMVKRRKRGLDLDDARMAAVLQNRAPRTVAKAVLRALVKVK